MDNKDCNDIASSVDVNKRNDNATEPQNNQISADSDLMISNL